MFKIVISFLIAFQYSALADLSLSGPLLPTSVEVHVSTTTSTSIKGTPCFTTTAPVTECRRKRGIQERAIIVHTDDKSSDAINPSQTLMVETTRAPRSLIVNRPKFNPDTILSSIDEAYYDSYKFFRQIASIAGRQGTGNMVTIGADGCSGPVDFSKFLSCIGLMVQETNTATSWFTATTIITSGYSTVTLAGCTPPFFPYPLCSAS